MHSAHRCGEGVDGHRGFGDFASSQPRTPQASQPQRNLRPVRSYQSSFTASASLPSQQQVQVGQRVEHARFGMGTVVALEGSGLDQKATVDFDNAGRKQLLMRFARFVVK